MKIIRLSDKDNVAIVSKREGISSGEKIGQGINARENLNFGEKIALSPLTQGDDVIRYGATIGVANSSIAAGSRVSHLNIDIPPIASIGEASSRAKQSMSLKPRKHGQIRKGLCFQGFLNQDGSVGTRNYLAIVPTVTCVSGVVQHAVKKIRESLLPNFPHVDGVVYLDHAYGCGVAINAPNADIPISTLSNLVKNPNFGGEAMLVGLGCEKLRKEMLDVRKHSFISLQDQKQNGFEQMVADIVQQAAFHLERLNCRRRQTCPLSSLVVGVQCGGSDSMSGITANPLVGKLSDELVGNGASVIFSETTEVRDAAFELFSRISDELVTEKLVAEFAWYDDYLARLGADHSANTTPGNKAGGIANIVEKAMGSVTKSGSSEIVDVIHPGSRLVTQGLNFLSGPASDFICGTLQFAAGANIHVFTTGRGSPYSIDGFPTVKVSSNSDLYNRWHDLIDFDAGCMLDSKETRLSAPDKFLKKLIAIASGDKTCAENVGISNSIVLFNPAAIT